MIYFLRRADGAIKIGTTEKYLTRLSTLTTEYGELELLGLMEGDREEEQKLLARFAQARLSTDRRTEWFHPSKEILDYIAENTHLNIPKARDKTVKITDKTHMLLQMFQNEHFLKTGERLTNDAAIALAIQKADPKAAEWAENLFYKINAETNISSS
jgi:hypothetical protein